MTDTEERPEIADAQDAIRTGDIVRLTEVSDDSGEFTMRLLVEGEETIDGRYFTEGAVEWRDLPLPLMMKKENRGDGHKESVAVGAIRELWREGNEIWGTGTYASSEEGQEARRLIGEGVLNGISADVGGASSEFEADPDSGSRKQRITKGIVTAATVLPIQAFHEARIVTMPEEPAEESEPDDSDAMVAAAIPVDPPKDWFTKPDLQGLTPITVTDDGHIFGHLAGWNSCHVGINGRCQLAPRSSSDYAFFAHGQVKTADGDMVRTGRITLGTGHAALSLSADAAKAHYDDTGTAVADIAVGEDEHGIWFSGALRPDVTPAQIRTLRASAVSGDWRAQNGHLELMALLAVNTPGFPVPRIATLAASASEVTEDNLVTFISAGQGVEVVTADCGCQHSDEEEFAAELRELEVRVLRSRVGA